VFADWILESWKLTQISLNKSSLAMRLIFGWMDIWTSKIVEFGTIPIHEIHLQMHLEKVTVWCGFWSGGIIRPYFFQNEAGVAITVNSERYRSMISNFLWPKMDDMDTDNMWFQQDGATCHIPHATMDILHERFEGIVSRAAATWTGYWDRAI